MPKPGSMIRETNCPASSMLGTQHSTSARNDHQTADHIFSIVANKLEHQKYNFAIFQIGGELHSLWTTAFRDLLDVERESIL